MSAFPVKVGSWFLYCETRGCPQGWSPDALTCWDVLSSTFLWQSSRACCPWILMDTLIGPKCVSSPCPITLWEMSFWISYFIRNKKLIIKPNHVGISWFFFSCVETFIHFFFCFLSVRQSHGVLNKIIQTLLTMHHRVFCCFSSMSGLHTYNTIRICI